jgi:aminopeptidase N
MYLRCFLIAFLFICGLSSCKKSDVDVLEKGVSRTLNDYRKKTISEVRYDLQFVIPEQKAMDIQGKVKISFIINVLDQDLVLDFSNDSKQVLAVSKSGKPLQYQFINEHIVIRSQDLIVGENEIEIDFVAGDLSLNRSEDYLYTLFVPDRASTCFPLFDQPNLKAKYTLTLQTPAGWEVVANGGIVSKVDVEKQWQYTFQETQPISSYLFAFAAGKFFKKTDHIEGREMTMYYRETDSLKVQRNQQEVFRLHAQSLAWLEQYTGIAYPFGKFDFALLPAFQYGGMEHPGAVFYNESALFLDENATVNQRLSRANVIAHESAHMWFGDLVTMDWFNDVWLKEVFANFMAAKIVHPSFPEINHNLRFLLGHYPGAYEVDRTAGTNPILQNLENLKQAGTLYGGIIYLKAPVVMKHLENKIGEDKMQEGLQDYLKKFAFSNAKWDDLIQILDSKSELDIEKWSNVWVKTAGMPVYALEKNTNAYQIHQEVDSLDQRVWSQKWTFHELSNGQVKSSKAEVQDTSPISFNTESEAYIFPNADGYGYGYFETDSRSNRYFIDHYNEKELKAFADPVFRGVMLLNLWERFLRNDAVTANVYLIDLLQMLEKENNPLLVDCLLQHTQTLWWKFLGAKYRGDMQAEVEQKLWKWMVHTQDKGMKMSFFKAFRNVVITPEGLNKSEQLWNEQLKVENLMLSEEDKMVLAYELGLKANRGDILLAQLEKIKNPDRKSKMKFVMPALSNDIRVRDAFFESLKKKENRSKESWVQESLSYLHHPLRQQDALKYLEPSLALLQEIQLTGDIFFPQRWLQHTFSGHSSPEADQIVKTFIARNPQYPYYLKNKILQTTDLLQRAVNKH